MAAFNIGETDGVIRLMKSVDREQVEVVRLAVVCEDIKATTNLQTTTTMLTIMVQDTNDNAPIFRRPFYQRSISENSEAGTTILNVVADDIDKNRTITYSLLVRKKNFIVIGIMLLYKIKIGERLRFIKRFKNPKQRKEMKLRKG